MASGSSTAHIIVTAADRRFWRSLYQFLRSSERNEIEKQNRFLCYDLGLGERARSLIEKRFPWCQFRDFDFDRYPPHVALNRKSYAWKPIVLHDVCAGFEGLVLWFDCATLLRTRSLAGIWDIVEHNGVYALAGQSTIAEHCDPLVLEALNVPFEIGRRREIVSGVLGFNTSMPGIRRIVAAWREHALCEGHIAPRPIPSTRYKNEQDLLSILLYRSLDAGEIEVPHGEIDISFHAPVRWMTSRNKVAGWIPLWADPLVRAYYGLYKTVDQALWKFDHFRITRLHGYHRSRKEHFSVFVKRTSDGKIVQILAPSKAYYADPFLLLDKQKTWLLVERFSYRSCCGDLCAIELDDSLHAGPPIAILPGRRHCSFPFVFFHNGRHYMVPETSADGTVEIHEAEAFPSRWRLLSLALDDIDAADSVIFEHAGLWWLVTAVRNEAEGSGRFLSIFFSNDFRSGNWQPHPVDAMRLYQGLPYSSGRNAGSVLRRNGRLLRSAQASQRFYGEGLQIMEIEVLTPTEFRERPLV
ncbi:MAG: DUF1647 domain-containing protein, partial [Alphaproteobacteria bacterium]|nr:DUF1647 domain-containing protein [Alphaproteobacteria bacterium]